jgi:hypothetical protein
MRVGESAYLSIPKRGFSGKLSATGPIAGDETVQAAIDQAGHFVREIRRGAFPSLPSKPAAGTHACSTYCEFSDLCRVSRHAILKARRAGV